MSKREYRRFTAEQKLEILNEATQPGVTMSEICRRHGLAPSALYRWRAMAQGDSAVALKRDAQRAPRKDDPEVRHRVEMERRSVGYIERGVMHHSTHGALRQTRPTHES